MTSLTKWWPDYAIKPSSYVSGLCYSILRGEPWTRCGLGCIYCYARWYRGPHGVPEAKPWWRSLWRRLVRAASTVWPRPWFRLSTLSDPVQPRPGATDPPGLVLWALRQALSGQVGIVLNTRSSLVAHSALLPLLQSLAEEGLVLVQVSLTPRGPEALLEPGAPGTDARLDAIEALVEHGVPVVVRVQPAIPGLEERSLGIAEEALRRGASGLIAEPLRETREGIARLYRLLGLDPWGVTRWEPYHAATLPGREGLLHPAWEWRGSLHARFRLLAAQYGAAYSSCKDGWLGSTAWPPWRPGWGDCCLYRLLASPERRGITLLMRPTLHEYIHYSLMAGRLVSWDEFLGHCVDELAPLGYRCGSLLEELPGWLRRPLRVHENMLKRLVEKKGGNMFSRLLGEDLAFLLGQD